MLHNIHVIGVPYAKWVMEQARAVGFDLCGIAPVQNFDELDRLPEWLARGYSGEMAYLRDERRQSPAQVLEGARSLIICALNYNTPLPYSTEVGAGANALASESDAETQGGPRSRGWISRYAWGEDYHDVLLGKLEALIAAMRANIPEPFGARAYVDTGPVVERVAAKYAGLGWLAKNTCLINPQLGSWLFLGVILSTLELASSQTEDEGPLPDLCGNCRLCIDACPTGAIVEPYLLDARRCISYLTIELRGSIPVEFREAMGRHVFGCDICQDVCPWSRKAPGTNVTAFLPRMVSGVSGNSKIESQLETQPRENGNKERDRSSEPATASDSLSVRSLFAPDLEWLASLSEEEYKEVFRGSAVKRAKWRGLIRNACVALGNSGVRLGTPEHSRIVAQLERLAASEDPIISEHARWAVGRLRSS